MKLKTGIRPIYNYPTVPETSQLQRHAASPPVTRGDMENDFRAYMQLLTCDWRTSGMYDILQQMELASVVMFRWHGTVEIAEASKDHSLVGQAIPGWEEAARKQAARGSYIFFNSLAVSRISKELFEQIKTIFGKRLLGFNEGEWDGAYVSMIGDGTIPLSSNRSRMEAYAHYRGWLGQTYADHHNYMITMSSACMGCHYGGELGTRMMAVELAQALPSNVLLMSFCRGAAKQYDLLFLTVPSVYGSRGGEPYTIGLQCYPERAITATTDRLAGPEHGASRGLLKRLWWFSYMSGASVTGFESGYFPCDATGKYPGCEGALELNMPFKRSDVFAHFTPLGWTHWEALQACRQHPLRGVPYIPIAVMLPLEHGWSPEGPFYGIQKNCVWGNIPYNAGDWQIDKFFSWVYPGCNLAHNLPCCDERGIITNTPFGDLFDVILTNASEGCLAKYQAVFLIGSVDVEADLALKTRLQNFADHGGTVISDTAQWPKSCRKSGGGKKQSDLISMFKQGQGKIIEVLAPAWAANKKDESHFESVKTALTDLMRSFSLIEIEGRPLYYLINVTDRPDELIITLCNNSHALSWEGTVRVNGQTIQEIEEWVAYGEADIKNGALRCGVPPNDVRVFRVRTEKPFLPLQFENIPWDKLGVGIPEGKISERASR